MRRLRFYWRVDFCVVRQAFLISVVALDSGLARHTASQWIFYEETKKRGRVGVVVRWLQRALIKHMDNLEVMR